MKSPNRASLPTPYLLDVCAKLVFIAAAAVFVSSIPVTLSLEFANSSATHSAPYGEAGLWSALGHKD